MSLAPDGEAFVAPCEQLLRACQPCRVLLPLPLVKYPPVDPTLAAADVVVTAAASADTPAETPVWTPAASVPTLGTPSLSPVPWGDDGDGDGDGGSGLTDAPDLDDPSGYPAAANAAVATSEPAAILAETDGPAADSDDDMAEPCYAPDADAAAADEPDRAADDAFFARCLWETTGAAPPKLSLKVNSTDRDPAAAALVQAVAQAYHPDNRTAGDLPAPQAAAHAPPALREPLHVNMANPRRTLLRCGLRSLMAPVVDTVVYDVTDPAVAAAAPPAALRFESRFESGNLRQAIQARNRWLLLGVWRAVEYLHSSISGDAHLCCCCRLCRSFHARTTWC